jgi:hypothetical protein
MAILIPLVCSHVMFLIKPLSSIFGVLMIVFIFWIITGGDGGARIERFCRPIGWSGNIVTSAFAIGAPSLRSSVTQIFANTEYACKYASWRLIYEHDWVERQQELREESRKRATPSPYDAPPKDRGS